MTDPVVYENLAESQKDVIKLLVLSQQGKKKNSNYSDKRG